MFCLGGFSPGGFGKGAFCPGGFCLGVYVWGVFCLGGFCPRTVLEDSGNQVMYYLLDDLRETFVSEELMLIPKDTELPLDYIQKW